MKKLKRMFAGAMVMSFMFAQTAFAAELPQSVTVTPLNPVAQDTISTGNEAADLVLAANKASIDAKTFKMKGTSTVEQAVIYGSVAVNIDSSVLQKLDFQNPNKFLLEQTVKSGTFEPVTSQVYYDGKTLYAKDDASDTWVSIITAEDLGLSDMKIKSAYTPEQVMMIEPYLTMGEDVVRNGVTYKTVTAVISPEEYKAILKDSYKQGEEAIDKIINAIAPEGTTPEDIAAAKETAKNVFEKMEVSLNTTYYINAETLLTERSTVNVLIQIPFTFEGEKGIVIMDMDSNYTFYDYNVPLAFPVVK